MAEKTILVCDVCGRPAAESVTIKLARGNFVKDMCSSHVNELIAGARRPRRGRPKKMVGSGEAAAPSASRVRAKKTATRRPRTKKTTARRRSAKKTAAKS
jgi:hypothetical protein